MAPTPGSGAGFIADPDAVRATLGGQILGT